MKDLFSLTLKGDRIDNLFLSWNKMCSFKVTHILLPLEQSALLVSDALKGSFTKLIFQNNKKTRNVFSRHTQKKKILWGNKCSEIETLFEVSWHTHWFVAMCGPPSNSLIMLFPLNWDEGICRGFNPFFPRLINWCKIAVLSLIYSRTK